MTDTIPGRDIVRSFIQGELFVVDRVCRHYGSLSSTFSYSIDRIFASPCGIKIVDYSRKRTIVNGTVVVTFLYLRRRPCLQHRLLSRRLAFDLIMVVGDFTARVADNEIGLVLRRKGTVTECGCILGHREEHTRGVVIQ